MRTLWLIVSAAAVLFIGGCACAERTELSDDLERFSSRHEEEHRILTERFERFAINNNLMVERLPMEFERFLVWRKYEWWRLNDSLAYLVRQEWDGIEKLSAEVGRYYGYQIMNFPRLVSDIENFFLKAPAEWRNLVMDVAIFKEYHARHHAPLTEELERFYMSADWEGANLQIDVTSFLEWRQREYQKLVNDGKVFFALARGERERLADGWRRMQDKAVREEQYIVADFERFALHAEDWELPRLIDDVWHFLQWQDREYARFRRDGKVLLEDMNWQMDSLVADIQRFKTRHKEEQDQLRGDLERFFANYEREVRPLSDEVKRFWRHNFNMQYVMVEDIKRFYRYAEEEAALLEADIRRFMAYGKTEWATLKKRLRYHFTCDWNPGFGDHILPYTGDVHGTGFKGDHLVPLNETGNGGW